MDRDTTGKRRRLANLVSCRREEILMGNEVLATLVHVSDLHIGEIDATTGDALVPQWATFVIKQIQHTPFDGLLGHHLRAVEELDHFLANVPRTDVFNVVVTGDRTRTGKVQEFAVADTYLNTSVTFVPAVRKKLGLRLNRAGVVLPGNHDQWGGKVLPLPPLSTVYPKPPSFPHVLPPITLGNKRTLSISMIDSDAESSPVERLLARGSFQNQIAQLKPKLASPVPSDEIRVLLIHHAWNRRGATLSMSRGSRAALEPFLRDYGFKCVLTGHTHSVIGGGKRVGATQVREFSCGTTTQLDDIPSSWKNFAGVFPQMTRKWPPNTLYVHTLERDPQGNTIWRATPYWRHPTQGFQPTKDYAFSV